MELRHLPAMFHCEYGVIAHVLKLDSYSVFEVAATRMMCRKLGVGIQFSTPYSHHMLGKRNAARAHCDEYCYVIVHCMTMNMYSLLI
jgi:hypothetical protein